MFSHCFRRFRIVFAILSFFGLRKDAEGAKICKKLLLLHRYGIEQSARFQADIHFAVRICHGRVFLTGTTGGGCRQWNDDG